MPADPEKTLLESLKFFWEDHELFIMVLGTLVHRIHQLVHIERLIKLAQDISDDHKLILMVICDKLVGAGDARFKIPIKKLKKRGRRLSRIPEFHKNNYLKKKWGLDPNFLKAHVEVPAYFNVEPKKFYALKEILKNNPWLKIRTLVGPNHRADLIYFKSSGLASSPSEAISLMTCSRSTVYRLWDSISMWEGLEKLVA